jgi:hypothetical protein
MERRNFVLLGAAALAACGRPAPAPPALPMQVAGWRRDDWKNAASTEAPAAVAARNHRAGFRTRWRAGAREIVLTAWAMGSDASAFEVQQKWPHAPGLVTFHHGWWFLTLAGAGASNDELIGFARDVEKALPAGR